MLDDNAAPLLFHPLHRAVGQLGSAMQYAKNASKGADQQLYRHLRAGAIQAFEYTYDLSISTLRRYLMQIEPSAAEVGRLSFNQLIRLGYDLGIIRDEFVIWAEFRDARNRTSHTYSENAAEQLYHQLPQFLHHVTQLLSDIELHSGGGRS